MAKMQYFTITIAILALASSLVYAFDPSPLQDFCVGLNDSKAGVFVNGQFCKDPNLVKADDFFFSGLRNAGNTANPLRSFVNLVDVSQFPGLNTLGVALVRIDLDLHGLNSPHYHPRAAEALVVLDGTLYVGFVSADPNNRLFTKVLKKGDAFVFPVGLIHFQLNVGTTKAVALAAFSSQDPGRVTIANAVFGSNPPIDIDVLTEAFQVDKNLIRLLQAPF